MTQHPWRLHVPWCLHAYMCVSRPVKSDLLLVNFGNSHPDREKVGRQAGRQALHKAMAGSLCMHASGASRLVDRVSQGVPDWQSIDAGGMYRGRRQVWKYFCEPSDPSKQFATCLTKTQPNNIKGNPHLVPFYQVPHTHPPTPSLSRKMLHPVVMPESAKPHILPG